MSAPLPAASELDVELKRLMVGTNDQRRCVGQTFFHFYKTLIFWKSKGLSFYGVTRAWSAGGATIFDTMATTLRELGEARADAKLRAFTARLLKQLGDDLEGGDHRLMPFLLWLERCFPELTEMMQAEDEATRIYDVEFAEIMAHLLGYAARSEREDLVGIVQEAARALSA